MHTSSTFVELFLWLRKIPEIRTPKKKKASGNTVYGQDVRHDHMQTRSNQRRRRPDQKRQVGCYKFCFL